MTDPEFDADGYPTEDTLDAIREWDQTKAGWRPWLDFIEAAWWHPDSGVERITDRDGSLHVFLHTWGWSGNEDIVYAMERNLLYGMLFVSQRAGGHFHLRVPSGVESAA